MYVILISAIVIAIVIYVAMNVLLAGKRKG